LRLPGPSQLVTTSGTTFSVVYDIGDVSTQVSDWTDISASWIEYVILGVDVTIMCMTPPTPGMAFWFFDSSANGSAPLVIEEACDGVVRTNHSMNANKIWKMQFRVRDPPLLAYRRTNVDYTVGYFKGLTNATNFGTSAANTLLYRFTVVYDILVRGRELS